MTTNKNNNSSMFLYTALIFVVALLLIILSLFGQNNLKKNMPELDPTAVPSVQPTQNNSITQKAAILSEENLALMEENKKLEGKLEALNALFNANEFMSADDKENAKLEYEKIKADLLSENQKALYDKITEFVK